jgi:hypothetical protein
MSQFSKEQLAQIKRHEAPKGYRWVCLCCGKTSPEQTGIGGDRGWDASCFLNSVLVEESMIEWGESKERVLHVETIAYNPRTDREILEEVKED